MSKEQLVKCALGHKTEISKINNGRKLYQQRKHHILYLQTLSNSQKIDLIVSTILLSA